MSNQPVANTTPTAGMIAKPGADGQQPDLPTNIDQCGTSTEYPNLPAPTGQVGYPGEYPSQPGPANVEGGFGDEVEPVSPGSVVGGADAGNDDAQENTVSAAVAVAEAANDENQADTFTHVIGDLMILPDGPTAESKHTGPPPGYADSGQGGGDSPHDAVDNPPVPPVSYIAPQPRPSGHIEMGGSY